MLKVGNGVAKSSAEDLIGHKSEEGLDAEVLYYSGADNRFHHTHTQPSLVRASGCPYPITRQATMHVSRYLMKDRGFSRGTPPYVSRKTNPTFPG